MKAQARALSSAQSARCSDNVAPLSWILCINVQGQAQAGRTWVLQQSTTIGTDT
nr:MAG TPA: hypothetical protein [Caudoviricetes sp.]